MKTDKQFEKYSKSPKTKDGMLKCPTCFKPMKMQIDPITKKKSEYLWRCECMPEGTEICIG